LTVVVALPAPGVGLCKPALLASNSGALSVNRLLKLIAVASVIAAGIGAATFFRAESLQKASRQPNPYSGLEFRGAGFGDGRDQTVAATPAGAGRQPAPYRLETMRVPTGVGRDPAEMYQDQPPPRFPARYPSQAPSFEFHASDGGRALPAWTPLFGGASANVEHDEETVDRRSAIQQHKIRDGDTLRKLSGRYLGDAERWQEIYDANRDSLSDPELLPVGTMVVIPPDTPPSPAAAAGTRLAPIPRGALRREPGTDADGR
jgi:nucleoid-associated protein YgaU